MTAPAPLSESRVAAFIRGDVTGPERAEIEAALDRDPQWLEVIAMMVQLDRSAAGAPEMSSTIGAVGEILLNLVVAELDLGAHDDALEHLREAEEIVVRDFGPTDARLAKLIGLRGDALLGLGRTRDAITALEHARSILAEVHAGPHPELAIVDSNLGVAYAELGELERAEASHRRAIEAFERIHGPDHPDVAVALVALGDVRGDQGHPDEAIALQRRALAIAGPAFAPYARGRLGRWIVAAKGPAEGAPILEDALADMTELELDPRLVADLELAIADARWSLGRHAEARAIANEAVARLDHLDADPTRAAAQTWIATHRAS